MKKAGVLGLVLISCILAGCGQKGETQLQSDKEVETSLVRSEIELPEEIVAVQSMLEQEDGSVSVVAAETEYQSGSIWKTDKEGENWEFENRYTDNLPEEIKNNSEDYEIHGMLSPDGDVYSFVWNISGTSDESNGSYEIPRTIYKISGQECTEVPVGNPKDGTRDALYHIYFPKADTMLADDGVQIFSVDEESGDIKYALRERDYSDELWHTYYATEDRIYVLTDTGLDVYDLETGEQLDEDESLKSFNEQYTAVVTSYGYSENDLMNNNYLKNLKLLVDDSGEALKIVVVDINGVYLYEGGELTLGAKAETDLNEDGTDINALAWIGDEIWLSYVTEDGAHLIRYTKGKSQVTVDTQLTLYTLQDHSDIRKVIASYEKEHPNVEIMVQNGVSGDDGVTTSDAVKLLNTNILAGDGPDLILLDGLSVDDYIEKNMLLDLSNVLDSVTEHTELFETVAETYQTENGIYAIPGRFALMFAGGTEDISSVDLENIENLYAYESGTKWKSNLFGRMATILYRSYLNTGENGSFSVDDITRFFENLATLEQQCDTQFTETTGAELYQLLQGQKLQLDDMGEATLLYAGAERMLGYVLSMEDLQSLYADVDAERNIQTKMLTRDGKLLYVPMSVIGISAASKQQEAAAAFLEYYFSEAGQNCTDGTGIPVNRNCVSAQLEALDELKINVIDKNGKQNALTFSKFNDNEIQSTMSVLDQATQAVKDDETVFDILMEQATNYLSDSSDLQTAAQDAYQKISLYLAE